MRRALDLAKIGLGSVKSNPMVGAVLVHKDRIIGEGWHKKFGGPHAEVEAIASVKEKELLKQSTLYVTLEPCFHFGKTPPCVDLILKSGIPAVVVAMQDPNPLVSGRGIAKLREEGVVVQVGLMENEAKQLNKRFLTFIEKQRPYIVLKWAQTRDGLIAPSLASSRSEKAISNMLSNLLVHKWRGEEDAIMVGFNTLKHDNPKLNVRYWETLQQPIRLSMDWKGAALPDHHFFDGSQTSILFNYQEEKLEGSNHYFKLTQEEPFLTQILARLKAMGIVSVLVEGGTGLLSAFIETGMWDEARICTSTKVLGTGIQAPFLFGNVMDKVDLAGDTWEIIQNPQEQIVA